MWKIFTVHGGKYHGTTRKYLLDYKWPFVCGSLFSPGITLRKNDALDYQITNLIYLMLDLLAEYLDHAFLVHLTVIDSRKPFLVD